jgi:hypothetical protein
MSRTINDLRELLFSTMEDLRAGKIDVEKAKQIGNIGQVIVNSAVAEVRHLKESGGTGTGFIEPSDQPVKRIARERTKSEYEKTIDKYN